MSTPIIYAIATILIIKFIVAVEKNARNAEETWFEGFEEQETTSGFAKGDFVRFCREFCDISHDFFKGDVAWIIHVKNETTVEVSNKPSDEWASDSEEPIKFSVVPEDYLQPVVTKSGLAKGDFVEFKKRFNRFSVGKRVLITRVVDTTTVEVASVCSFDGIIDKKIAIVPETILSLVNQGYLDYLEQ